eukprot:5696346-Pyramimonas_sp.AAC.1
MVLDAQNACFHAEEDEEVYVVPPAEWSRRYHARGGQCQQPWRKMKKRLGGERGVSNKFNQCVIDNTSESGIEHAPSSRASSGGQ